MQVELSLRELEFIARATFQQTLETKERHKQASALIGSSAYHSLPQYRLLVSNIGHQLNDLRELTDKIDNIIYEHHNQLT
jgi:predicted mannosyl-3-phosphoglycerate phosphatase (HAD superfamily)